MKLVEKISNKPRKHPKESNIGSSQEFYLEYNDWASTDS